MQNLFHRKDPFIAIAPMEGVVDWVMRQLLTDIGGFDHTVTEFVRITHQLLPEKVFLKYCPELKIGGKTRSGIPVFVQLLGSDCEMMALNAKRVANMGALGIDLNFGCPAKTVNRHDGGATLLKHPQRVFQVVEAVREAVPLNVPVTAKVRLGFDHKDYIIDIAKAAEDGGASTLTVHGRTKTEGYRPPAAWEPIGRMADAIKIPVIANGDIWTSEDYFKCREVSGCKHVALGRGVIAKPDLAIQIKAAIQKNDRFTEFEWDQIKSNWIPLFLSESRNYRTEDYAVARGKQWIKLLGRQYPQAKSTFEEVKIFREFQDFQHYFNISNKQHLGLH